MGVARPLPPAGRAHRRCVHSQRSANSAQRTAPPCRPDKRKRSGLSTKRHRPGIVPRRALPSSKLPNPNRRTRLRRTRRQIPRRIVDPSSASRTVGSDSFHLRRTRPQFHSSLCRARRSASRGASSAHRPLGALGRHRLHRMDPLLPRSAQSSLHLPAG